MVTFCCFTKKFYCKIFMRLEGVTVFQPALRYGLPDCMTACGKDAARAAFKDADKGIRSGRMGLAADKGARALAFRPGLPPPYHAVIRYFSILF